MFHAHNNGTLVDTVLNRPVGNIVETVPFILLDKASFNLSIIIVNFGRIEELSLPNSK